MRGFLRITLVFVVTAVTARVGIGSGTANATDRVPAAQVRVAVSPGR